MKSVSQNLKLLSSIMDNLIDQGVVRTSNNPASDYAEWLFAKSFRADLQPSSNAGYDAVDRKGVRYQVKARRMGQKNRATQLGVIRDEHKKKFDYLVVVLFNHDFTIKAAYLAPHSVVAKYGKYSKHQNGHVLHWRGGVANDKSVKDITKRIHNASK